ncbi:MAG: TIGR03621 family F420-dependent LLM class oxidoreductase [Chloroflexota bacterium]
MRTTRPFRFGIQAGAGFGLQDPRTWMEHARMAEDIGYAVLLAPDHFAPFLSPLPALAAAAQATSHIRLGTLVINQAWRHPAVLAKEAATVDLLSGGRLELGLGTGWVPREQAQVGIAFEPFAERFARFAEYVAVVKGLLRQPSFTFSGTYYQIQELEQQPRPVQPRLPIMIGGYGRRVLELASREADILSFASVPSPPGDPYEVLDGRLRWVAAFASDHLADIELSLNCAGPGPVGATPASGRQTREPFGGTSRRDTPSALAGSVSAIVDKLIAQRERYGISYITYFPSGSDYPAAVRAFGQVVRRLAGT